MKRPPTEEVIIERPDGARVGVRTAALAAERYPGATILSYGDGRPYDGPEVTKQPGDMTRDELNAYAVGLGIEQPAAYPNKAALLEAVNAALAPASDPDTAGTGPAAGESGEMSHEPDEG